MRADRAPAPDLAPEVLSESVEIEILRDGQALMTQIFTHSPIRFGRILDNDVVLPFDSISRNHCELVYRDGAWWLIDLKSLNGVKVGDERVQSYRFGSEGSFILKPLEIRIRRVQRNLSSENVTQSGLPILGDEDLTPVHPAPAAGGIAKPVPTGARPIPTPPGGHPRTKPEPLPQHQSPVQAHAPGAHTPRRPLVNIDALMLLSRTHPSIDRSKNRALQVVVFWHEIMLTSMEFLPGEDIEVFLSDSQDVPIRFGIVGDQQADLKMPRGFELAARSTQSLKLTHFSHILANGPSNLSVLFRFVPTSRVRRVGVIPIIEDALIDPLVLSGAIHGSIAIATFTMVRAPRTDISKEPVRLAKIVQPTPAPLVAAPTPQPTPTPFVVEATPFPTPEPTPLQAQATPLPQPTPPRLAQATPPPKPTPRKELPKRKDPPRVAKQVEEVEAEAAPQSEKPNLTAAKPAKDNPPPPGPKSDEPVNQQPVEAKPFQATSVGALKTLSLLSSGAPPTAGAQSIVVRKGPQPSGPLGGGGGGSGGGGTTAIMNNLPATKGGDPNGVEGGMALAVSSGGAGYGTKGYTGKAGTRGIKGSVVGGATFTNISKQEGLTREQVMKVVQKHHAQIQQCYERSLLDDPALAGRAEFEWEINPQGSVEGVSVKESTLRNGEKLLNCVKGVFRRMKFPAATNGASTTPTIGLPFGRL